MSLSLHREGDGFVGGAGFLEGATVGCLSGGLFLDRSSGSHHRRLLRGFRGACHRRLPAIAFRGGYFAGAGRKVSSDLLSQALPARILADYSGNTSRCAFKGVLR